MMVTVLTVDSPLVTVCTICCSIKGLCTLSHWSYTVHMLLTINTEHFPEKHELCGFHSGGRFFFVHVRWKLYFLISIDVLHSLKTLGGIHKASNPKINLHG